MKAGDLVRSVPVDTRDPNRWGIVVEVIQKKCWRTEVHGPMIDWRKIDPEPHAVVMFHWNNGTIAMPVIDLELIE